MVDNNGYRSCKGHFQPEVRVVGVDIFNIRLRRFIINYFRYGELGPDFLNRLSIIEQTINKCYSSGVQLLTVEKLGSR